MYIVHTYYKIISFITDVYIIYNRKVVLENLNKIKPPNFISIGLIIYKKCVKNADHIQKSFSNILCFNITF